MNAAHTIMHYASPALNDICDDVDLTVEGSSDAIRLTTVAITSHKTINVGKNGTREAAGCVSNFRLKMHGFNWRTN